MSDIAIGAVCMIASVFLIQTGMHIGVALMAPQVVRILLGQQWGEGRARRQCEQAGSCLFGNGLELGQQFGRAGLELGVETDDERVGERHQRGRQYAHGRADQLGARSGQGGGVDCAQHGFELADGGDDLVRHRCEGDA